MVGGEDAGMVSGAEAGDHLSLPPVLVPSDGESAAQAGNADVVVRIKALVSWVGAGRELTRTKRLRVGDARELARALGWTRSPHTRPAAVRSCCGVR